MDLIGVFLISVFASFFGAMVGGGGLITIPFFIFLGLPPQVAIATNKAGSLGLLVGSFLKYFRSGKIQWKVIIPFSVMAFFAGVFGSYFLLSIDTALLEKIIAVIILLLLILILIKRDLGLQHREVSILNKIFGYIFYFLALFWGAFFGGGFGVLVSYVLVYLFGFTMIETAATSKIPSFVMGVTAVVIYSFNGLIYLPFVIPVVLGMFLGGYLGASFAVLKGNKVVKLFFVLVVIFSAVKLLFF